MTLYKSKKGKILIILYYAIFGIGICFLTTFIILKIGILAGMAASFVLGIICGITGGELEFIEHKNVMCKKYKSKIWQDRVSSSEEPNKVIFFPEKV